VSPLRAVGWRGLLAGASTPGARLALQPDDLRLEDKVVPADALAPHLAGVDEVSQPLGAIARLCGGLGNQDQLFIPHARDYIAARQYRTTIGLEILAKTNYNIGREQ
jgi:hypothetical protein